MWVITVLRTEITAAGAGVYSIVFTADESFEFITLDPSVTFALTVEESVVQTYGVTVEVQGSSTQTTTTAGTGDIEYTLRVTNTGSGTDSITLTKSGVATATLSKTSLSSLAANAYEDVTLTIPQHRAYGCWHVYCHRHSDFRWRYKRNRSSRDRNVC